MIKRCNDFGAGGVSVAIGELADGLDIDLDAVPKKYEGLDGTELAISESQERMAVALARRGRGRVSWRYAAEENLEATPVAEVTEEPRVRMAWNGDTIVDVSRAFLASNGAPKHQARDGAAVAGTHQRTAAAGRPRLAERMERAGHRIMNVCSSKGLCGALRLHHRRGHRAHALRRRAAADRPRRPWWRSCPCSGPRPPRARVMAWGFDPYLFGAEPVSRAPYLAVVESRGEAGGCRLRRREDMLSLRSRSISRSCATSPERWGKPMAAPCWAR